MKRANRLPALLTACLLLAGCTAAPQSVSLPARSSAPAQSSTRSAGANPDLAGLELQVLPEMSAVTAEGLYTVDMIPLPDGSIRILYGDFASSSLHPLCSLPGCDHTGSECQGRLMAYGGIRPMVIGGRIFLVLPGAPDLADEHGEAALAGVMTMEPDGSGKALLTRFGPTQQLYDPYITDGKDLYCTLETAEAGWPKQELIRVELATGEWESIYQMSAEHSEQLMSAFGSCVLLSSQNAVQGKLVMTLARLDLSTGETTQVPAPDPDDTTMLVQGRQIYYYSFSENALHGLDWLTLEDRVLKENLFEGGAGEGFVNLLDCRDGFALLSLFLPDSEQALTVRVDLNSGESADFSLLSTTISGPGRPVRILTTLPGTDRYLVEMGEQAVDYPTKTSDGTPTVVKATRPLYGLIDTADYWSSSPDYQALTYSD